MAEGSESEPRRRVNTTVAAIGAGLIVVIVLAVVFAFKFVEDERERNLQAWQIRLGIVADSHTAAVNEWVDQNFAVMRELAENEPLQLYMTELALAEGDRSEVTDEPAQAGYLRNLLVATADRAGFVPPPSAGEVAANIEKVGVAGIGLVDANGLPIVSSPQMPPIAGRVREAVAKALSGEPAMIDMYVGASNLPTIGFVLPVFALQDDTAQGIGAVVGVRIVDDELFGRLSQPGDTSATTETYLIRADTVKIDYLSPLADGTPALKRSLARDTTDLAAAFAAETPGGFAVRRDYAGTEVLVTSRPIGGQPWILVRKISRAEALEAAETRLTTMLTVFILIIIAVAVTIVLVWRHGASLRAQQAAEKFRIAAERFENIGKFMWVVTNSQPTRVAAVDGETHYTFANKPAADEGGLSTDDILGKSLASVMGPVKAQAFAKINRSVMSNFADNDNVDDARESHILSFEGEGTGEDPEDDVQVIKSDHIPLRGDRDHPPGVLMILDDITELTRERRRSENMLRKLIDTLVTVVDRRDPFSANHSIRVAEVSRTIAEEMDVPQLDAKTVDIAGSLMNLGKIFVPPDLLAKAEPLTDTERKTLATTYRVSAELLRDVPFEGPVVQTIEQMGENWDGSGPLALKEEDILPTARILAVANAFLGMISVRAYREAMTFQEVSDALLQQSGTRFDRKPVSALINIIENRDGSERWAHFREVPPEAEA